MVPCPWARDAAAQYRGEDVGVHLTLNAEWETYRWGPITYAPSLLDGDGGFPRTMDDTWDHADIEEVRRECRAQVERAILWGFDVSHLDSHMGTLQLRARVLRRVPRARGRLRTPAAHGLRRRRAIVGFPYRDLAAAEGVVFPDHFVYYTGVGGRRAIERALYELRPGVTEVFRAPGGRHRRAPRLAPRLGRAASKTTRSLCHDRSLARPRRARRRDAHRLPRAPRPPTRALSPAGSGGARPRTRRARRALRACDARRAAHARRSRGVLLRARG